jgi:uncharacterized protein (DUF1800 family)
VSQSPSWIATARLLRRAGFGATGPTIDAVAAQDPSTYLDVALGHDPNADPGAVATPIPALATPYLPRESESPAIHETFKQEVIAQMRELSAWWVRRMAAVQQPVHEKLTLLWHNHFATSVVKTLPTYMALQNEKLRSLKLGDFATLAQAMLTDGAMLYWLDGVTNTKEAPNENLAREFMELFALGYGNGYTEADVREAARALTGRFVGPGGQTVVAPQNHDGTTKTVLGVTGNLDDADFCDIVLRQPMSAPFVAAKLWRQLAADAPPSPATLDRLVAAYGPGRDLKALTKAVLLDPEFAMSAGAIVVAPVEWLMGVIRSLSVPLDSDQTMAELNSVLTVMGQRPFYPPDVSGWPRGRFWLSSNSAAARVWAAARLADLGDLSIIEHAPQGERIDAVGYLIGVGTWSDRTSAALTPLVHDPARLLVAAVNAPEYLTT